MSMNQWDAMNTVIDRMFGPAPAKIPRRVRFADLNEKQQREWINAWWSASTYQQGMLGEAVNEHASSEQIREAYRTGDHAELGRLVTKAVNEYCGQFAEEELKL